MPMPSSQRRTLKARAHSLAPVVMIGASGLTAAVLKEIELNLKSHELIKIHAAVEDRATRDAIMTEICTATEAEPVQAIGRMLVVYRENALDPSSAKNPSAKKPQQKRKPPRPLKRTFQHIK